MYHYYLYQSEIIYEINLINFYHIYTYCICYQDCYYYENT